MGRIFNRRCLVVEKHGGKPQFKNKLEKLREIWDRKPRQSFPRQTPILHLNLLQDVHCTILKHFTQFAPFYTILQYFTIIYVHTMYNDVK